MRNSFFFFIAVLSLSGCDVFHASLLDGGNRDSDIGCRRGTADCDGNGSCEALFTSVETCGSCDNRCVGAMTCNPSTLSCQGDAGMFDANVDDAGMDSAIPDGGVDAAVVCGNVPPPRPTTPDDVDVSTITYALKDIILDQRVSWEDIGWNLDERCSFAITDDHLCVPSTAPVPPLDGPGGVDNSFGENLLGLISMFNTTFEVNTRASMEEGEAIIIRLKDWNGTENDPDVEIILAVADTAVIRSDGNTVPQWDGDDRWNVVDSGFSGGNPDRPLIFDDRAYVANGVIVARIPDRQPIALPWLEGNTFELRLTDALFTARISADTNRLEDAWITGRYGEIDLADAWQAAGFCEGGALRNLLDIEISEDMDVRSTPGSGGAGATCNAISVALAFTGYRGDFGGLVPAPIPDPTECIPDPF